MSTFNPSLLGLPFTLNNTLGAIYLGAYFSELLRKFVLTFIV